MKNKSLKPVFVTQKDIAKILNLSVTAVSKALKDSDDISVETKELIKAKAIELGYIPNSEALSLKKGGSDSIAVISNDILNPYFSILSQLIVDNINELGLKCSTVMYCQSHLLDFHSLQGIISSKYCGIVSLVEPTEEVIQFCNNSRLPLCVIGIKQSTKNIDCFYTDDIKGGRLVGEYFLKQDCQKGLYISNSMSETSYRRYNGFSEAFISKEKEVYCEVAPYNTSENVISKTYNRITKENFDFVFCYSDYLAISLKRYLKNHGYKNKVTIFGFDNLSNNYDIIERINSVGSDTKQIVKDACQNMYDKITGKIPYDRYIQKKYDMFLSFK